MIYDGCELPPFEIWVAKVVITLIANFYAGGSLYYNNFIISFFFLVRLHSLILLSKKLTPIY